MKHGDDGIPAWLEPHIVRAIERLNLAVETLRKTPEPCAECGRALFADDVRHECVSTYTFMTDIIREQGTAAFGTRLRRLSERLDRQVQALYRAHDVGFEPRWYPVVTMLHAHGGLSVGE